MNVNKYSLKELLGRVWNGHSELVLNKQVETVGYSEYTQWDTTVMKDCVPMSEEEYTDLMQRVEEFENFWKERKK